MADFGPVIQAASQPGKRPVLLYHSRRVVGAVVELVYKDSSRALGGPENYVCARCLAIKRRDSDPRPLPRIHVREGRFLNDPDRPLNPHFCTFTPLESGISRREYYTVNQTVKSVGSTRCSKRKRYAEALETIRGRDDLTESIRHDLERKIARRTASSRQSVPLEATVTYEDVAPHEQPSTSTQHFYATVAHPVSYHDQQSHTVQYHGVYHPADSSMSVRDYLKTYGAPLQAESIECPSIVSYEIEPTYCSYQPPYYEQPDYSNQVYTNVQEFIAVVLKLNRFSHSNFLDYQRTELGSSGDKHVCCYHLLHPRRDRLRLHRRWIRAEAPQVALEGDASQQIRHRQLPCRQGRGWQHGVGGAFEVRHQEEHWTLPNRAEEDRKRC
uniref:Velvet domain-containing protein n=1 Tax=Steinernema glaseri TaxID=37863 RepID=A0A1I8ARC7_9BILA